MAERERGMGRGLAAILASSPRERSDDVAELRDIPTELIAPNPRQPRRRFDEAPLLALAESLRERGVLQPVLVRPVLGGTYELIAGERRWRAAQLAGVETVPAVVRAHDDSESFEIALIENMARQDLNPIEEARACALLVEEMGLTREEIGRRVGKSRVSVSNLMRLLDLPDDVLELLETGSLSEGHGRALLMAPDHGDRRQLARDAVSENWTVREVERRARDVAEGVAARRPVEREPHPDQVAAAAGLSDLFASALGTDVKVAARGQGYRISLSFATLDDAHAAAERLGVRVRDR